MQILEGQYQEVSSGSLEFTAKKLLDLQKNGMNIWINQSEFVLIDFPDGGPESWESLLWSLSTLPLPGFALLF